MAAKNNEPSERISNDGIHGPTNPMVTPLLNDLYQFTMAYAYWKAGKHQERAVLVFIFFFSFFEFLIEINFLCFNLLIDV
jgi:nicotinate phosphoribosyltransferase